MTDTLTHEPATAKRKRRPPPPGCVIQPLAVCYEDAGWMLGRISERAVERLVAEGKLRAQRATDGRRVIAVTELRRYLDAAPSVVPGVGQQ